MSEAGEKFIPKLLWMSSKSSALQKIKDRALLNLKKNLLQNVPSVLKFPQFQMNRKKTQKLRSLKMRKICRLSLLRMFFRLCSRLLNAAVRIWKNMPGRRIISAAGDSCWLLCCWFCSSEPPAPRFCCSDNF